MGGELSRSRSLSLLFRPPPPRSRSPLSRDLNIPGAGLLLFRDASANCTAGGNVAGLFGFLLGERDFR